MTSTQTGPREMQENHGLTWRERVQRKSVLPAAVCFFHESSEIGGKLIEESLILTEFF